MRTVVSLSLLLGLSWAGPQYQYQTKSHNNMMGGIGGNLGTSYPGSGGQYYPSSGGGYPSSSINPNLSQIKLQVESEIARELPQLVQDQHRRSSDRSYSRMQQDKMALEQELRYKINDKIQTALRSRFGVQAIRGSNSYSLVNGRFSSTPNYSNQELEDVKYQIENELMRQLDESIRSIYGGGSGGGFATTSRPYQPLYPVLPPQTTLPPYSQVSSIISRVEMTLNDYLNKVLQNVQQKYFSPRPGQRAPGYDWNMVLSKLQQELRGNISQQLNNEIVRHYGNRPSYNPREFDDFKRNIENTLNNRLSAEFNRQKDIYLRSNSNLPSSNYGSYPSNSYNPQPSYPGQSSYNPYGTSNIKSSFPPTNPSYPGQSPHPPYGGSNIKSPFPPTNPSTNPYGVGSQSNYGSPSQNVDWPSLQRQAYQELSRQLQDAIASHQSQIPYMRQAIEQQLAAQIVVNVTRELNHQWSLRNYQTQTQGSQFDSVRRQLERDLQTQLQQNLLYSGSADSYGSHYNSRPVRSVQSENTETKIDDLPPEEDRSELTTFFHSRRYIVYDQVPATIKRNKPPNSRKVRNTSFSNTLNEEANVDENGPTASSIPEKPDDEESEISPVYREINTPRALYSAFSSFNLDKGRNLRIVYEYDDLRRFENELSNYQTWKVNSEGAKSAKLVGIPWRPIITFGQPKSIPQQSKATGRIIPSEEEHMIVKVKIEPRPSENKQFVQPPIEVVTEPKSPKIEPYLLQDGLTKKPRERRSGPDRQFLRSMTHKGGGRSYIVYFLREEKEPVKPIGVEQQAPPEEVLQIIFGKTKPDSNASNNSSRLVRSDLERPIKNLEKPKRKLVQLDYSENENDLQKDRDNDDIFHSVADFDDVDWPRTVYPVNTKKNSANFTSKKVTVQKSSKPKSFKFGPQSDTTTAAVQKDEPIVEVLQILDDSRQQHDGPPEKNTHLIKQELNTTEVIRDVRKTASEQTEFDSQQMSGDDPNRQESEDQFIRQLEALAELKKAKLEQKPSNFGEQVEDYHLSQQSDLIRAQEEKNKGRYEPKPKVKFFQIPCQGGPDPDDKIFDRQPGDASIEIASTSRSGRD